ncbi:hypothetical protein RIR_jg40144.t1 [Rhizophagus irregularis DAOM 181602=DAOM 197198]|uniref:Uncharacterized protein n=1 Tax=Rhizophagus irregularis (strain DAOM 181602 / DAOM 197198 / MUCL 43194) TaxID=747089 RepID=U9TUY7_RHIID|nr:hypothetical protein RIR_jg40144.t1 [Rhizophagus irregularis DAOM 181602=DAOM 197198]
MLNTEIKAIRLNDTVGLGGAVSPKSIHSYLARCTPRKIFYQKIFYINHVTSIAGRRLHLSPMVDHCGSALLDALQFPKDFNDSQNRLNRRNRKINLYRSSLLWFSYFK